ncbi:hypothetical protein C9I47_2931 [Lysobacter maris]|nr:hypothetical protein C9I47_2931 [Lysobacter maris]
MKGIQQMKLKYAANVAAPLLLAVGAMTCAMPSANAAENGQPSRRYELVHEIMMKWGPFVAETYQITPQAWAREMGDLFATSSLDTLQAAANANTLDQMTLAFTSVSSGGASIGGISTQAGDISIQSLGDAAADLVYVPVPPCRIFDTRVAGGIIGAGSTRNLDVTAIGNYSGQGGDASNCNGVGAAGSFAAAAINFSVVTPSAQGFITAFPFNTTRPLAATMAYNPGVIDTTLSIVALDQGPSAAEMSLYSSATTHVVGDIVGYFINPQATALQCVETAQTIDSVAPGATKNTVAPACAAGYTQTSTNCESSTWQMPFVFFSNGTCSAQNNSGGNASLRASRTCCRVPGR